MDSNMQQPAEINLRSLIFVLLRKIWTIMLVGIILAGALFGYKMITNVKDANVLDTSKKLEGESDVAYSERVLNVNRAEDIIHSIDVINGQIENQRQYLTDSLLMQINAGNEAVTIASFLVTINGDMTTGVDVALMSNYNRDICNGDYLDGIADELGTKRGYLTELITVGCELSDSTVVKTDNTSGSVGTLTIVVIGSSTDDTDRIMDMILEEVNSEYIALNESIVPHTISLLGKQSYYMVDNATRETQYNATSRFEILQKQIETYNESLDEIASAVGVSSRGEFYAYFSFDETIANNSSIGSSIKLAVVGFAVGAVVVALIVIGNFVFGRKFTTQSKFFLRFSRVYRIGVTKPANKRSCFIKFIDRNTGDDNGLSDENNNKLIAANIRNLTEGMNKVLFTGTAELSNIKALVAKLGIEADVKDSFFNDPASLESISGYEGIIVVEQRNYSDCSLISEELKFIENSNAKLIGAVII